MLFVRSAIFVSKLSFSSLDTSLAPVPSRGHLSDVLSAPEISEFSRGEKVNSLSVEAADTGGSECRVVHKNADNPTEQDGDARADTETNFEEDPSVIGTFQFPAESLDTSLAPVPSRGHLSDVLSAPEMSGISRGKKVNSLSVEAADTGGSECQ